MIEDCAHSFYSVFENGTEENWNVNTQFEQGFNLNLDILRWIILFRWFENKHTIKGL